MRLKKELKIYVLDGDIFTLNIYQQHLINLGYNDISIFHNAADCMDNLIEMPDIIFLDHNINFLNGVDVLKKIKKYNPHIYVIFIAGIEDIDTVVSSLQHGAFDFIVRGTNDVRTLDSVITKIQRIKELLNKCNSEILNIKDGVYKTSKS